MTAAAIVSLVATWVFAPAAGHGGGPDTFVGDEAVYAVTWSRDGSLFATGTSTGNISVYDGVGHRLLLSWHAHGGPINELAFSPVGAELASASGSYKNASAEAAVKVWALPLGGEPTLRLNLTGHYDWIPSVVWSPDGRFLASSSGVDDHVEPANAFGEVFLWDAATGVRVGTFADLDSYPHRLAWSPDGREIAALGHLSDIWLLNATTREQLRISPAFRDPVGHASHGWAVDWSPDARYIVGGFSRDIDEDGSTDFGAVVVFDTLNLDASGLAPLVKEAYVHKKPTQWVSWDSTGSYISSCSGADVLGAGGQPGTDGVVDVGEVVVYNFSRDAAGVLEGLHIFRGGFGFCSSVDFRPGNLTVLAGNADGSSRLYFLDEDRDGCWVWDDDAPLDSSVCEFVPPPAPDWWTDPIKLGLVLGGVGAIALGATAFLLGRRREAREREEAEAPPRRGRRRAGNRANGSRGRPRGGRRGGARR